MPALVQEFVQIVEEGNGQDINSPLDEFIVVCPKCKTLETLWFAAGFLVPTRKFRQSSNQVYHDCGSIEPCSFFHL
jgi:hypothetical protein